MSATSSDSPLNIDRLNAFMDQQDMAAVVARPGKNFTYLAGFAYPGTLARLLDLSDAERGVMVAWPREGEPCLIVNLTAAGLAERDSRVRQQVHYEGYVESPHATLTEVLKDMGLARVRVGFERDFISAQHCDTVQDALLIAGALAA